MSLENEPSKRPPSQRPISKHSGGGAYRRIIGTVDSPSPFTSMCRQLLQLFEEFRNPPAKAHITARPDPSALENLIESRSVLLSIVEQVYAITYDTLYPQTLETTAKPIKIKPFWSIRRWHRPGALIALTLILGFFGLNPDFLKSQPRRVIRIAGQDFDQDRFEVRKLLLPPELVPVPKPPPKIAENIIPATPIPPPASPEPEISPPLETETPPEPAPSETIPPPPVIGPDDLVAEGASPEGKVIPREESESELSELTDAEAFDANVAEATPIELEGEDGNELKTNALETEEEVKEATAPLPENTNPRALTLPDFRKRAESIIDEQIERHRRESASGRRIGTTEKVQELPNFSTEDPTILSDTRGYDFGPYMNQVINRVRVNWYSLIPEAARLGRRGRVVIIFTIREKGEVDQMRIVANSGAGPLDRSATAAIQASNPFPPLPSDFDSDNIVLQFTFMYNMR